MLTDHAVLLEFILLFLKFWLNLVELSGLRVCNGDGGSVPLSFGETLSLPIYHTTESINVFALSSSQNTDTQVLLSRKSG